MTSKTEPMRIGWAAADITPEEPVAVCGQFHVRVSEGVADPLTATVLALESGEAQAVFVTCDLVGVSDVLRNGVLERLGGLVPPEALVMNATHSHTGPEVRLPDPICSTSASVDDLDLPIMPVDDYVAFAADRIARAVEQAWTSRAPGKIAYGLGHAVVGRNRRWVDLDGNATMYGNTDTPGFSHIEGYEDHNVNVLATYDLDDALTGVVVNVPCPSQVDERRFVLSADYWHETRQELRRRLGDGLFVLAQCSAAGDQSPHPIYGKQAEQRMWKLAGRTEREILAGRISDAVTSTLAAIADTATGDVPMQHHTERIDLPLNALDEEQVATALAEAEVWEAKYEEEREKLDRNPELRNEPRWYVDLTRAARRAAWFRGVAGRFERQKTQPTQPVEFHVVRLGDIVFSTNPFEYYLDFGMRIKCRSKAVQTFLVQLAGRGTYVPSPRSTAGGGYGSIPASNPFGPVAGRLVAERSIEIINSLFDAP
jgi:hypothetical protein